MSRAYPALDLIWALRPDDERLDILVAEVDEEGPAAVEEWPDRLRIYFPSAVARGRAAVRIVALEPDLTCEPVEVPDEAWAERSQASLSAVRVGRIVVAPPWAADDARRRFLDPNTLFVTIQPSMGFGTAHHASTRLCLRLLQEVPVGRMRVLDVGTGSGVLAIAAARLGAARVLAVDNDGDALTSAAENVELNAASSIVTLQQADLAMLAHPAASGARRPAFDLVLANLTGAALLRHALDLASLLRRGGSLVVSGIGSEEAADVTAALVGARLALAARADEDDWTAARFTSPRLSRARSRARSAPSRP